MPMGYNSNLSYKKNKTLAGNGGERHPLWVTGTILRIVGLLIVIPAAIMTVSFGGWGFFILFNPITLLGALSLAFGQYFVSNWKNR